MRAPTLVASAFSLAVATLSTAAHAQPTGHRKPPPEAFTACEGKSQGADCQVTFRDRTIAGVCVKEDQDAPFCMPNDMPPPPSGDGSQRPPPNH